MSVFSVTWDAFVPCVVMSWDGYATSAEFRAANDQVYDMIVEKKASKLLGDITNFKLIGMEDQAWLNDVWIPRVVEAGLRHVALMTPIYYFNKVAVATVSERLDPTSLTVRHFDDKDKCRQWLMGL